MFQFADNKGAGHVTPENFCYWLKGIFEIQEAGHFDASIKRSIKLTESQIEMINEHLGYVFAPPTIMVDGFPKGTVTTGASASDLSSALSGGPMSAIGAIC